MENLIWQWHVDPVIQHLMGLAHQAWYADDAGGISFSSQDWWTGLCCFDYYANASKIHVQLLFSVFGDTGIQVTFAGQHSLGF